MVKRNSGLDLCRLLSMIGIIGLHVIGQGGVLNINDDIHTASYWISEWMFILFICSVDIFAMMSGYLGINKSKVSCYRVLELISIVLFFSIIITVIFTFYSPIILMGIREIINGFCPPLAGRYWYITCFIPVLIFQPYINKMIIELSIKQHRMICILSLIIFSIIPSILNVDFFKLESGYSFIWLLICYVFGAYLKRIDIGSKCKNIKIYAGFLFLLCSFILLSTNILLAEFGVGENRRYLVSYTSPFVLLMGLSVFIFCKNLILKDNKKLLMKGAENAFDVYIIHAHPLLYDYMLYNAFVWISALPALFIPLAIIFCSIVIYVFCYVLGALRSLLFEKIYFNRLLLLISKKIDLLIYK